MAGEQVPEVPPIDLSRQSSPDLRQQIEFVLPGTTKRSDFRRLRINSLYFAVLGLWAIGLALTHLRLLGILSALVLLEIAVALFKVSTITGPVVADQDAFDRLRPILVDLCTTAKCVPPQVVLRDDAARVASVRRPKRVSILVLSLPFVKTVTDQQLRAIVAHEIVHLAHDDVHWAKIRAAIAAVGGFIFGIAVWLFSGYVIVTLPVFLAASTVGILAIRTMLSPLNRRCEVRADVEGAALGGSPAALAEALAIAHTQSRETRRRLYGRQPWRSILFPLSWTMPTHPKMQDRIARLQAMT